MPEHGEGPRLSLPVSETRDHIRGSPTAAVTLVEYGDYECPHCREAQLILEEVEAQLGDEFRLVFRHFPLTQMHPHAEPAAEAAEAANAQGRFWQMHETLYANQPLLGDGLANFANELGLDMERFLHELQTGAHRPRVREDFLSGVRSGVNGTPTFFINGTRHDGSWDAESLALAIMKAKAPAGHGERKPVAMKRSVR